MAMNKTTYLANQVIDHNIRGGAATPTGTPHLMLVTTTSANAAGSGGTEVVGGSYARKAITLSASASGVTANTNQLQFTNMPACTVIGIYIVDASSSGNKLYYFNFASPKTFTAGETLTVEIGDLDLSES